MVHNYGGCPVNHIKDRLFGDLKSLRVVYREISDLIEDGWLAARRLPSTSGIGSGKTFLTVTPAGRAVVAQALGLQRSELGRSRLDSPKLIQHHLAICSAR